MTGDAAGAVRAAGKQIVYVHVSDNSGLEDQHDMPGYGSTDTPGLCRALGEIGYHGTMMLEVFYGLDRLRRIIDEGYASRLAEMFAAAR